MTFQELVAELGNAAHVSVFEGYLSTLERRMKLILMICDQGCRICPEEAMEIVRINLLDAAVALADLAVLKKSHERIMDFKHLLFNQDMLLDKLVQQLGQFRLSLARLEDSYGGLSHFDALQ